jgi:putative ATP-dependent endonuclease of OLD family
MWLPSYGVNFILGGGDTGKTTILEAIGLLLNPTNTYVLTDADYFGRDVDSEFYIEAAMSLPEVTSVNQQTGMNWPWIWDGLNAVLPKEHENGDDERSNIVPVYILRVRGTSELELSYEIVQPDGNVTPLSVALRRTIGLVRLLADDRNDRDLRLIQGSGLDRLLSDKALRSRVGRSLAARDVQDMLSDQARTALTNLETSFAKHALPGKLGLGITGGPGLSINALIGLTADKEGVILPLASWGAGTRRLASLTISDALQGHCPITIIDEIERGLEPYRLRRLLFGLQHTGAQVFITTHSATALSVGSDIDLWYLDLKGRIGELSRNKIDLHRKSDPDTFLARLAIICEGSTEVGFVSFLLSKVIPGFEDHGVWITDGRGHDNTLKLCEALSNAHLTFGAVVDNEGRKSGTWAKIKQSLGELLVQWDSGCLEEQIIPLFHEDRLYDLVKDPLDDYTGMRLRSLADRIGIKETDFESIQKAAAGRLTQFIVDAACGKTDNLAGINPEAQRRLQGYKNIWFKSRRGGQELAEKVIALGAWPKLRPVIIRFFNAVRQQLNMEKIEDLTQ